MSKANENTVELEPSKAWIKNVGIGSAKKMPRGFKRYNQLEMFVTPVRRPPTARKLNTQSVQPMPKFDAHYKLDGNSDDGQCIFDETVLNDTIAALNIDSEALHSTVIGQRQFDATVTSTTCMQIAQAAHDLRNMLVSEPNYVPKMLNYDADLSMVPSYAQFMSDKDPKDRILCSERQTGVKPKVDAPSRANNVTIVDNTIIPMSIDSGSFPSTNSTVIGQRQFDSTITSTTCMQIAQAAYELRNMHMSGPKHVPKELSYEGDSTLVPSYAQLVDDSDADDCKLCPERQTAFQSKVETPSNSNDEYITPVFMRDEDVNRLIGSGQIYLKSGKLYCRGL